MGAAGWSSLTISTSNKRYLLTGLTRQAGPSWSCWGADCFDRVTVPGVLLWVFDLMMQLLQKNIGILCAAEMKIADRIYLYI